VLCYMLRVVGWTRRRLLLGGWAGHEKLLLGPATAAALVSGDLNSRRVLFEEARIITVVEARPSPGLLMARSGDRILCRRDMAVSARIVAAERHDAGLGSGVLRDDDGRLPSVADGPDRATVAALSLGMCSRFL